jgi:hypothetical protein
MAHTTWTRLQDRPSLPSRATRVGHGPSGRAKPLQERRVDLDLLAGALAGAAAVWVMDRVDWFNSGVASTTREPAVRPAAPDRAAWTRLTRWPRRPPRRPGPHFD